MKINTLLAVCLLAFSPLALAAPDYGKHANKEQASSFSAHAEHKQSNNKDKHGKHDNKMCKEMCKKHQMKHGDMKHADMDHSKMDHGKMGHDMSKMNDAEHMKAMEKMSGTEDCAKMCKEEGHSCDKGDCNDCCDMMHEKPAATK